jgi:hypothetical protein
LSHRELLTAMWPQQFDGDCFELPTDRFGHAVRDFLDRLSTWIISVSN